LWFAHYCLDALAQLRAQRAAAAVSSSAVEVLDASAAASQWSAP
jgi:hypothetical protein